MKPPIFVIGNPRSGTTLLRLMLNSHPNIVIPPECGFAVWWYEKHKSWTKASAQIQQELDSFLQDLARSRKMETWGLDFAALSDFIKTMQPSSYSDLVSTVYTFFGHSVGETFDRWGDKNNFHIQHIGTLNELFPDALFVHIVRDGRDVACSYRALARMKFDSRYAPNLPTDIAAIAYEWTSNLEKTVAAFDAVGWHRVHQVRYEDLVARSQRELKKICLFLNEPYDPSMLDYFSQNQKAHQEPVEFLQWKRRTLQEPTTSEVGKYRAELTGDEIDRFEQTARHMLERYGYS